MRRRIVSVLGRKAPSRKLLFLAVFALVAPLALASQATASPAARSEAVEAPALDGATSACTTAYVLRHGTKVVVVRGTRIVTAHVRRGHRLVPVRRRVRYRHHKRVRYSFRLPERHCPPPGATASLTISTSTLPASGGSFTLTYSAANASSCALTSSPGFWTGSGPSISCNGSYQGTVGPSSAQRAWTFVFTAIGTNGQQATAVQTLTEQAPAPTPPAPATSSSGAGGAAFSGAGSGAAGGGAAGGGGGGGGGGGASGLPPTAAALAVTTTTLPGTTEGSTYSAQLTASGGTAPYAWSVVGGSLPSGLDLASSGALTGTAAAAGTASFTVEVTDSSTPTHQTATASLSITVAPSFSGQQSPNWSGYVWPSSSPVTAVAATWAVPTLDCSATPNAGMSSWVGTGGIGGSSGDLLQTGVRSDCVGGAQQDVGWWEEFPEVAEVDFSGFPVSPGDVIKAQVVETTTPGQWETLLDDTTTGLVGVMVTGQSWGVGPDTGTTYTPQGSTTSLSYGGGYSGEWVVEDYTDGSTGQQVPFADFGSVSFTNMALSPGPAYGESQDEIELVEGGQVLAVPTLPTSSSMTVSYTG